MLFNSTEFILYFLPATLLACWLARRLLPAQQAMVGLLNLASLVFYAWWEWRSLWLILLSISANFMLGTTLQRLREIAPARAKRLLTLGVVANVAVLGYYKYTNFLVGIAADLSGRALPQYEIILPLAISFFTFTQIAFLVDCYSLPLGRLRANSYALFVLFFPHLIAGPIVHHRELTPQLEDPALGRLRLGAIGYGLAIFVLGLFKKTCLADTFGEFAAPGFDQAKSLSFLEAWSTALSYTFQLYFDFSGYCDMAIGLALMVNVTLPPNFDAPYRALSIQDFWKRWHMTLGRFLREYVYVPLGGNRRSQLITLRNLFLTFLIGGIWHGAGWTFVIWGALHGLGLCAHRIWSGAGMRLPKALAWAATFLFVVVGWVFFRATSIESAMIVLRGMSGASGFELHARIIDMLPFLGALFEPVSRLSYFADGSLMGLVEWTGMFVLASVILIWGTPLQTLRASPRWLAWGAIAALPFVLHQVFFSTAPSAFLYFRF